VHLYGLGKSEEPRRRYGGGKNIMSCRLVAGPRSFFREISVKRTIRSGSQGARRELRVYNVTTIIIIISYYRRQQ